MEAFSRLKNRMERQDVSCVLRGRRVREAHGRGRKLGEGRLPPFVEPWSAGCDQYQAQMQLIGETNQGEMESALRLEVSKVETLE